jgi:hypothetical protein
LALTTPASLVSFALKAAGITGVAQPSLAEDFSDVFDAMNGMLAQWNRKRWITWDLIDVSVVSTGALHYSVGPNGDINIPQRPDRLESAFFRQLVSPQPYAVDYPLEILESREDYNSIALKSLVSWPQYIFYDSAYSQTSSPPLCGFVYPWPVPQASLYELHLSLKVTIAQFSEYIANVNMPPEYVEAIWTNLALRVGAMYPGSSVPQLVVDLAKASLATIRGANAQIARLKMPEGLGRPALYNIYSDQSY